MVISLVFTDEHNVNGLLIRRWSDRSQTDNRMAKTTVTEQFYSSRFRTIQQTCIALYIAQAECLLWCESLVLRSDEVKGHTVSQSEAFKPHPRQIKPASCSSSTSIISIITNVIAVDLLSSDKIPFSLMIFTSSSCRRTIFNILRTTKPEIVRLSATGSTSAILSQ